MYEIRHTRKDIGVFLVTLLALGLGWLLFRSVDGRVTQFQSQDAPLRFSYPGQWHTVESLQDALLKVEDPLADSTYKTTLTAEMRQLDPASPPTLQTLLDRRVEERQALTGYHFLDEKERTVDGAKAMEFDYAYVTQPIDAQRRASLPVVVQAREVIIVTQDRTYYLTLAAPHNEYQDASARFDRILQSVKLQ